MKSLNRPVPERLIHLSASWTGGFVSEAIVECGNTENRELLAILGQRLTETAFALRHVEVAIDDNRVVLRGRIGSCYQKQLAQESLKQLIGDRVICNNLIVVRNEEG